MDEKRVTIAYLSELTGCGKGMISRYVKALREMPLESEPVDK